MVPQDLDIDIMREFKDYKTAQGIWLHGITVIQVFMIPITLHVFTGVTTGSAHLHGKKNIPNYPNRDRDIRRCITCL